jgi:hypothetical protein
MHFNSHTPVCYRDSRCCVSAHPSSDHTSLPLLHISGRCGHACALRQADLSPLHQLRVWPGSRLRSIFVVTSKYSCVREHLSIEAATELGGLQKHRTDRSHPGPRYLRIVPEERLDRHTIELCDLLRGLVVQRLVYALPCLERPARRLPVDRLHTPTPVRVRQLSKPR